MRLSELLKDIEIEKIMGDAWENIEIISLSTDSRKKMECGLFFCMRGENFDSHAYARQAMEQGAVAIITERVLDLNICQILVKDSRETIGLIASAFYGYPARSLKIVGITGTNGKTTTSYMLAAILEKAQKKVGIIGTLGICYANKKLANNLTTPDPLMLQRVLAEMLSYGIEYVVMEVSAHALYYKKVAGISFSACIFTNLTQDHLDFFETMQNYREAKKALFHHEICPIAILNGDEETGRYFGVMRSGQAVEFHKEERFFKTLFYGLKTPSDAFAVITDEGLYRLECMLNINDNLCRISLSLTGKHNVYNALAAATCAMELGIATDAIESGLSELKGVKGRLENIATFRGAEIYVDFAHTPDGLEKSLDSLRPHCKGRLICVFGCGGNRDKTKRSIMGETAARKTDFTILTSDNPRYEDPLDIIAEIEKGYRRFSVKYVVVPERKKALDYAVDFLKKDDVLLIAGKGGEEYQEIMGIKYSFSDHDTVRELLSRKK
jgi:UDP-N-acetylmuramoyl-L-alanyl-D-glutamate--2,6-diaminopimelate ligase